MRACMTHREARPVHGQRDSSATCMARDGRAPASQQIDEADRSVPEKRAAERDGAAARTTVGGVYAAKRLDVCCSGEAECGRPNGRA